MQTAIETFLCDISVSRRTFGEEVVIWSPPGLNFPLLGVESNLISEKKVTKIVHILSTK